MQDNIINAHRLIGETIRDPEDKRLGKIVGVDQSRAVPVIFVIWRERAGVQRFELTRDELRQLTDACCRAQSKGRDHRASGHDEARTSSDETSSSPAVAQRRVGFR